MLTGISTIYLSAEFSYPEHPSIAILAVKKEQIRELYNKLNSPGGYPYENIDLQADIPTLSTRREGGGLSMCQIGKGKIRIVEEKPAFSPDEFGGILATVFGGLPQSVQPFIIGQKYKIRCTAQPANCDDSIDLLAGNVANALTTIEPFGRPPSFFGLRFRFPPATKSISSSDEGDAEAEASEHDASRSKQKGKKKPKEIHHRGYFTLRFETFGDDIKKVWIEVESYFMESGMGLPQMSDVAKNIKETHEFATKNAIKFLNQFDKKDEKSE